MIEVQRVQCESCGAAGTLSPLDLRRGYHHCGSCGTLAVFGEGWSEVVDGPRTGAVACHRDGLDRVVLPPGGLVSQHGLWVGWGLTAVAWILAMCLFAAVDFPPGMIAVTVVAVGHAVSLWLLHRTEQRIEIVGGVASILRVVGKWVWYRKSLSVPGAGALKLRALALPTWGWWSTLARVVLHRANPDGSGIPYFRLRTAPTRLFDLAGNKATLYCAGVDERDWVVRHIDRVARGRDDDGSLGCPGCGSPVVLRASEISNSRTTCEACGGSFVVGEQRLRWGAIQLPEVVVPPAGARMHAWVHDDGKERRWSVTNNPHGASLAGLGAIASALITIGWFLPSPALRESVWPSVGASLVSSLLTGVLGGQWLLQRKARHVFTVRAGAFAYGLELGGRRLQRAVVPLGRVTDVVFDREGSRTRLTFVLPNATQVFDWTLRDEEDAWLRSELTAALRTRFTQAGRECVDEPSRHAGAAWARGFGRPL